MSRILQSIVRRGSVIYIVDSNGIGEQFNSIEHLKFVMQQRLNTYDDVRIALAVLDKLRTDPNLNSPTDLIGVDFSVEGNRRG